MIGGDLEQFGWMGQAVDFVEHECAAAVVFEEGLRVIDRGPGVSTYFPAVSSTQTRDDAAAFITIAEELGLPFDGDAQPLQPGDQQPLVLVLRKDLQEGIRGQIRPDFPEVDARPRFAFDPEPHGRDLVSVLDDEIGEVELAVELERARVDGERAGRRAWR